jgi:hypothetical protein
MAECTGNKHRLWKVSKEVLWINMTEYIEQYHLFNFLKLGQTTLCTSYTATQKALLMIYRKTMEDGTSSRTKHNMMPERFVRLLMCVCLPLHPHDLFFDPHYPSHKKQRPTTKVCFLPHIFLLPLILRLGTQEFTWVHANR